MVFSLYLYHEKPKSIRPILAKIESVLDGTSTSVSEYGINGDEASSLQLEISAPASALRVREENSAKKIYYMNETRLTEGMPYWVAKFPFMPSADKVADEDRVCYVHVGKTAGSSMACSLGFYYDSCPTNLIRLPNGNLPKFTTSMFHKQFNDCENLEINLYLFVIRNPLSRMQSWFTYERPTEFSKEQNVAGYYRKEKLFLQCPFPTLNALGGELGLGAQNQTVCSTRAWEAITGLQAYSHHNYYNYKFYYNEVLQQDKAPRIVVLRTEHLEQDWKRIEMEILHGPKPFDDDFTFPKKHSSHKDPEDYILSPESQRNVCHALCTEIQVYKRILQQAENIDKNDYAISMQELKRSCPVEAALDWCS